MDIFSNRFGRVEADRVTFNLRKGWFSGSVKTDYPTKHITSISLDISRHPIWGVIFILVGLPLGAEGSSGVVGALLLIAVGIYFLLGRPAIQFATAGGERIISFGQWIWQKNEAQEFVDAIKRELFDKQSEETK